MGLDFTRVSKLEGREQNQQGQQQALPQGKQNKKQRDESEGRGEKEKGGVRETKKIGGASLKRVRGHWRDERSSSITFLFVVVDLYGKEEPPLFQDI
mmetsp:Transcript_43733/g.72878  ORF Transcript_43733/g.72878 Transcript_43733/m.72878 type:complete len:97 (+) Transcript_43733:13-303(+)